MIVFCCEFVIKKIHLGELSVKMSSLLLFCCNSIVVGKLLKFMNLLNSLSFIPPSTQKINNELDKNNKDNKCLFELFILQIKQKQLNSLFLNVI